MKLPRSVHGPALASLLGLALGVGCATPQRSTTGNSPAVALIVRIAGGGRTLSPREFTKIHQALQIHLIEAGYTFARNADAADYLVTVRFTPDPLEPDGGHVAITGVDPNPMRRRRSASIDEASPETRALRQKMQDLERWIDSQAKSSS